MSRKQKKHSVRGGAKSTPHTPQGPEARERDAMQALEAERWRDAMRGLKALLKEDAVSERTPARRLALAEAYAGRARELSAKGMTKEALVIWENRAALGPEVPPALEHGLLQLRLGNAEPLLAMWSQTDALSRDERQRVGEHLAAAVLAGDQAVLGRLAADDPLRRQAEPAHAALAAYCAGDQTALAAALARIPFRSAYRPWALLLKALGQIDTDPQAARGMLGRIGEDCAFAPLRRAAEIALLPDPELIAAIAQSGPRTAAFAAALRGWSAQQLELVQAIASLGDDASSHQDIRHVLQRHRALLGEDWVQHASLRLLPLSSGPLGRRRGTSGLQALSKVDRALVEAWSAEAHDDPWDVIAAWEAVASALSAEPEAKARTPEACLSIALVLRRFDATARVLEVDQPESEADSLETLAADQLERSLRWDPGHRETYLRLVTWYRRAGWLKDARRVLGAALERWPRDIAVLEAGMETALAADAFKKAAGLARQMLEIDPINSGARRRLVDAHIKHAEKQVLKGRGDLARKELRLARQWTERGASFEAVRERLSLLDGLLVLVFEDVDAGRATLRDLLERRGKGMAGRVDLMLAANLLAMGPDRLANLLQLGSAKVRDRADLLAVISHLRSFLEQTDRFTVGLKNWLTAAFTGAPWKQLESPELDLACETLRRLRLSSTRHDAARAALKRWPRAPVFEYHAFESQYAEGGAASSQDLSKIQQAAERAEANGDARTANRLRELSYSLSPFGGMPPYFVDPWDDMPNEPPAAIPEPLFDEPDLSPLLDALDGLPLKRALEQTGMPKALRKHFLKLARDEGEDVVIEMLKDLVQGAAALFDEPAAPRPAGRRQRNRDGDSPDQFDLF